MVDRLLTLFVYPLPTMTEAWPASRFISAIIGRYPENLADHVSAREDDR